MNNNNNNNNGQRASFAFFAQTIITTDGKGKSSLLSFLFSSNKILQLDVKQMTKESKKSESSARALKTVFRGQIPTERDTETRRRSMSSQKTRSFSAPRVPSRKTPPPVLKAGKTSTTQTVSFSPCAGTIKPPPKNEEENRSSSRPPWSRLGPIFGRFGTSLGIKFHQVTLEN